MPFHVRCTACNKMIAKGVRFNALRKKAGRYLGTIIYEFTMPCSHCKNTMIIKTDPKNCEYLLVLGCVRYKDEFKQDDHEVEKIQTPEEGEQINKNPFKKLEVKQLDVIKADKELPRLQELLEEKQIKRDDFYLNQTLRRKFKMEKNQDKRQALLSEKKCLDIKILPHCNEDKVLVFNSRKELSRRILKQKLHYTIQGTE